MGAPFVVASLVERQLCHGRGLPPITYSRAEGWQIANPAQEGK